MRISTTRMVAWSIGIASIMLAISALVLIFIDRHAVLPAGAGRWTLSNLLGYIVDITIPVIGIVLASRRPQNPIGWLFVAAGFLLAFSGFGLSYGLHALVADPGSLPAGRALVWGSSWLPGPGALAMLAWTNLKLTAIVVCTST
jgi:cytochrome b subunit of formate dehydrogenase